ncbi:MAG: MgtC/SapB family protein [Dehalococcoidia bacterium]|nr:MAG: MgtC/SapB family protein [Dehalococcoidia bacterium]
MDIDIWQLTPWDELDMVLRLVIAALLGGIVGIEREHAEKPAGLRTLLLVCTGSALFTIASIYGFGGASDAARVAAGIVAGIGFLGAGTILRSERGVVGITTAATIWTVAAIGLAVGAGLYLVAIVTTVIALIALRLLAPPRAND